jgi:3-deoxy-manno-octulosonate cytidylyltransferase (CMP-KDO synthetase)
MANEFVVIIPARFGSTRLLGKPLLPIAGRPMIEHVYQRGLESGAHKVVVATDDPRIRDVVQGFGGEAMLTSADHVSGTDRLAEVAEVLRLPDQTIVVNLQGDEPLMPGTLVKRAAHALAQHAEAGISTLAGVIREPADVGNPNVVKVVLDARGFALYFSRAPIPWVRGEYQAHQAIRQLPAQTVLRHFGLYGYRAGVLRTLARAPVAPLEAAESLEQLRALSMGVRIRVEVVDQELAHGVDTEEDLRALEALMANASRGRA